MQQCPKCKADDIHRSRARNRWESWRKNITGKRPYRCRACLWRGWGHDLGPRFDQDELSRAQAAVAPEPPNLKGTVLTRETRPRDLEVKELDHIDNHEKVPETTQS